MLKNYINETYLKGKVPELVNYLWTINGTAETTYDKQKQSAEQIVYADMIDRGYQLRNLRPHLVLATTLPKDQIEDYGNRVRAVAICTTVTGTATIAITGTDDTDEAYASAGTSDSLTVGTNTFLLNTYYKYYKYAVTGTATLSSVYLVEASNYDLLFAYKWLELILRDVIAEENDQYHIKANEFAKMYNDRLQSFSPFYDKDEDGDITADERSNINYAKIQH